MQVGRRLEKEGSGDPSSIGTPSQLLRSSPSSLLFVCRPSTNSPSPLISPLAPYSHISLGLVSLTLVDLEILQRSGISAEKKQAGCSTFSLISPCF
ncbi:unnamed protein product [Linum trigynum]|uniref:Uncharacterized protein n=1 Tax=Linum trigynum TaxID=586398 RepID=A0AAV2EJD9_9ROSI